MATGTRVTSVRERRMTLIACPEVDLVRKPERQQGHQTGTAAPLIVNRGRHRRRPQARSIGCGMEVLDIGRAFYATHPDDSDIL